MSNYPHAPRTLAQILADHSAWLGDPATGRRLVWAYLTDDERALFPRADLSRAKLIGADLSGADLREANLRGTNFSGARLGWTNFSGANLSWANLNRADLRGAKLRGVDLRGADLDEANLRDAHGIAMVQAPTSRRTGYAVAGDPPRVQLGCWWGSVDETCARIREVHGDGEVADIYVEAVRVAARIAQHTAARSGGEE